MKKSIEVKGMINVDKEGLAKVLGGAPCASGTVGTCALFIMKTRLVEADATDHGVLIP